jgi:UDP-N-acetylglucosamine acyltransferase
MTVVHPTAIVNEKATLGEDVEIGPYSVIGPNVKIGKGSRLMSHVVLDGHTTIGEQCRIFPFASIGTESQDLKYKGAESFVTIGDRTVLREYATVNSGTNEGDLTSVGSDCFLMAYTHVAHACKVGDKVVMANCATLAGHVVVEERAILGGFVAVHQFARIGTMCMIGGCTKIVQDCPPFMLIDGSPAQVRGTNAIGLKRNNFDPEERKALKGAYKLLYRSDLSTKQALERIRSELGAFAEVQRLVSFIEMSQRGIIK